MNLSLRRHGVLLVLVALFTFSALATAEQSRTSRSDTGPALVGWYAPPTYTPPHTENARPRPLNIQGGELTNGPLPFFPVTPCRQYDSRNTSVLANNTPRTVNLSGSPCLIPSTAAAISVNITVFSITGATGNGVFKVGIASPPTTAWINYPSYESQRGNAGVVSTDGSGNIVVQVNQGAGSVNFTVDVNGYYYNGSNFAVMPTGDFFGIVGDLPSGGGVLFGQNNEASGISAYGVHGRTESSGAGSAGVRGVADAATGATSGVQGNNSSTSTGAVGVYGVDSTGDPGHGGLALPTAGVRGASTSGYGVFGVSTDAGNGVGVKGVDLDTAGNVLTAGYLGETNGEGVLGLSNATTGVAYGVRGSATPGSSIPAYGVYGTTVATAAGNSAGVEGTAGSFPDTFGYIVAGVRGDSTGIGVLGNAPSSGISYGVFGATFDTAGAREAVGVLGYKPSASTYGVYSFVGDIGCAACAKSFVEPHPTDAAKVIRFVSIEGDEAGVYTRGSAQTINGRAVIQVPEGFRMVTEADGLTVQLTPMGALATMAVESKNLNQIVVLSSRDVSFDYLIQGVHHGFKNFQVIRDGGEFTPHSPDDRMPDGWSEPVKQALIANGTYNPDGTVNLVTAERLGWAQAWREADDKAKSEARKATVKN